MFLQQLVNGITLGAVYTLLALSYSLVMGILGILNLAIAELFMFGGLTGFTLIGAGYSIGTALAAGMAISALFAVVIEKLAYQPLRDAPLVTPMLSTLGFSIILQNIAINYWGSDPVQLPAELLDSRIAIGPIQIGTSQILVIGVTIVMACVLAIVVQSTQIGRALRAVAESREIARTLGVAVDRLTLIAFVISGLLAGAAGVLIGMHYSAITPYAGADTGLKAIAVMVVGGVTNIWGGLLAGPLIGIAEVMTVAYGGSQLRDFIVYGIMILILLIRPQGLLGASRSEWSQRV
ncbi:MAG: branched-chain amino acid ABC transporter permease [Rhodomicrobium sp.]